MNSKSMSKFFAITSVTAIAAAALSGCVRVHHHAHLSRAGRPMVVAAQLDCPQSEGWLTRVSISADGTTCQYRGGDVDQVTLTRLPLNGQTPQAVLAPIETSLKTLIPPRKDDAPSASGDNDGDNARIDVPGVHIDAHGDKAVVKVFGVTIDADNDKANIHAGLGSKNAVVLADHGGAEVRATDIDAANANLVLILASEKPGPTGFRSVGYMARGPVAGPLVVLQYKSTINRDGVSDDHDLHRLMDLNVTR
jgi:hypothetical protein